MSSESTPRQTEPRTPHGGVTCEAVRLDLTRFRDGELDERQFGRIRAHLLVCPECRAELSAHETLSRLAREWRVTTPDIWRRVSGGMSSGRAPAPEEVPFVDLRAFPPEPSALAAIPAHVARKHRALPVKKEIHRLWVAMENPRDVAATDEVRRASGCLVVPLHAVPEDLDAALTEAYGTAVPPAEPPRPPTAVGAPAPLPGEDAPLPPTSFWVRFGQRVADAFPAGGNPTPQQMMEARDLLRRAADEIDAMLASAGYAPADEIAEIRREIAGLREEVAALRSVVERRP